MCGRFTMTYPDAHMLAEELGVPEEAFAGFAPHYNIAPTQDHYIVRIKLEEREVLPARWGLINSWAEDAKGAAKQINARAEGIAKRPAFRDAFARRRCVVPADGFFEWKGRKGERQPYWIRSPDGKLLLLAGLYESWQPEPGQWQRTFTIVTTGANGPVSELHDRMPGVLDDEDADRWMLRTTPERELKDLLRPAPDDALVLTAVSQRVNKVDNDDPGVLEPAEAAARLL